MNERTDGASARAGVIICEDPPGSIGIRYPPTAGICGGKYMMIGSCDHGCGLLSLSGDLCEAQNRMAAIAPVLVNEDVLEVVGLGSD